MEHARTDREPCPFRIVEDAGGAFVFGLVGGSIWHFVGGIRNAPKGQRLVQAISRTKARVPITGGSFAVWGVLFSCCDCTFTYFRKKEDPWNAIISGAATGGILAARAGIKAAGRSAIAGGAILAAIEGLNILIMRVLMPSIEQQQAQQGIEVDKLLPPSDPSRPRAVRNNSPRKPLFEANPSPSPLFSFPSPSIEQPASSTNSWDTPGFSQDKFTSVVPENTNNSNSSKGSSWKFW